MSQHDFNIANQTASNARADINNALTALASLSSGSTAPTTTYANMLWYDTGTNILKMRTEADDAWISVCYLDQSGNNFRILDNTQVTNISGTQTGLLGDQTQATWEAGTGTTESLVSPAKIKAAIETLGFNTNDLAYGTEFVQVLAIPSGDNLDVTLPDSTKYSSVTIEFHNVCHTNSTDSALWMRFSTDGGTTFKQSSNSYVGNTVSVFDGTKYAIRLTGSMSNSTNRGICGEVNIYDYDTSSLRPHVKADLVSDDGSIGIVRNQEFARVADAGPYNLVRFNFTSSRNIRAGQGRVIVRGHSKT